MQFCVKFAFFSCSFCRFLHFFRANDERFSTILHFTFIIQHFLERHIERRGELPSSQIIVVLERQVVAASQIP